MGNGVCQGFIKGEAGSPSDDLVFFPPPRGLQPRTAPDRHGDTSSSISSIQPHGPEAGSVLQNAESRSLAGAEDEGRQQRVGSFTSDLEAMVASSRLTDRLSKRARVCVCVASTAHLLAALCFYLCGTSSVFVVGVRRQKDKERKSRLSLFLTKSGSHENVSPRKKNNNTPANK